MTLALGSVTIDSVGGETTSPGVVASLYAALKATASAAYASFGQTLPPSGSALAQVLKPLATSATDYGTRIYTELTTNAHVSIVVPVNAFGAGIPSSPVTLNGGTIS